MPDAKRITRCLGLFALLVTPALAQEGQMLEYVHPQGGQVGTTVEVIACGNFLQQPEEVIFYQPGIRCTKLQTLDQAVDARSGQSRAIQPGTAVKLTFDVSQDAEPGEYQLRLRTRDNLSELVTFWVTPFPLNMEQHAWYDVDGSRNDSVRPDVFFDCIAQALEYQHRFRRSTSERAVALFEGGSRDNFNSYFFSTFGQAKRETVCTCETLLDANLSQTLHLINGRTIEETFQRNPVLIPRLMKEHTDPAAIIGTLYIRILCREPSDSESKAMLALLPENTDQRSLQKYYSSVAWSLVNSNEFIFNH